MRLKAGMLALTRSQEANDDKRLGHNTRTCVVGLQHTNPVLQKTKNK